MGRCIQYMMGAPAKIIKNFEFTCDSENKKIDGLCYISTILIQMDICVLFPQPKNVAGIY